MDRTELKRLSKKHLGSESRYVKLMNKGTMVPKIGKQLTDPATGKPMQYQLREKGMLVYETKYYTQEEIEALFMDLEQKEAERKEQERLKSLAESVRGLTGISS